jgi:hypothetical protein
VSLGQVSDLEDKIREMSPGVITLRSRFGQVGFPVFASELCVLLLAEAHLYGCSQCAEFPFVPMSLPAVLKPSS